MKHTFKDVLNAIKDGKYELTQQIGDTSYYMIEKTPYSFHFYATYYDTSKGKTILTEMLYDLRNKEYHIVRNGRQVQFSVSNLDTVIPREKDRKPWYVVQGVVTDKEGTKEKVEKFFEMVSVKENEGMYKEMVDVIGSLGDERVNMSSRALIRLMTEYNKLELIYKAGMDIKMMSHNGIRNMIKQASMNNTRKLHQIFGLTKSQLKFIQESDEPITPFLIRDVSEFEQKHIDDFRSYIQLIKKLESQDHYNIDGRLNNFLFRNGIKEYADSLRKLKRDNPIFSNTFFGFITEYSIPNPKKLMEYLLFECLLSQGMEFTEALMQYRDYYRMCKDMDYKRFDRYPRFLKTYHDIIKRNYDAVANTIENEKFEKATNRYRDYESKVNKDYSIVTPKITKDLVFKGNALSHCVGSYIKQVVNGFTEIMFLRDNKDLEEPLVTVEVRNKQLSQARGQFNRLPNEDERKALNKFAEENELEVAI